MVKDTDFRGSDEIRHQDQTIDTAQADIKRQQLLDEQGPGTIRRSSPTGGLKDNIGKPRVDLLSSKALIAMAGVVGYGASKYHPHNWRMGISWSETYGSAMRHLLAWNDGEDRDLVSGHTHLAHAATQIMFLIEYAQEEIGADDRFTTVSEITTEDYRDKDDPSQGPLRYHHPDHGTDPVEPQPSGEEYARLLRADHEEQIGRPREETLLAFGEQIAQEGETPRTRRLITRVQRDARAQRNDDHDHPPPPPPRDRG